MNVIPEYRQLNPGEKLEALFLFQAGTVWASLESVYYSCLSDNRVNVRLVLVTETAVEKSHMAGAKQFLEESGLEYENYEEIDFDSYVPHVVFIQFPYDAAFHTPDTLSLQFKKMGTRVVYVPYGIEISDTEIARKDHFNSFVVENCWRLYTSSRGIKEEYDKYCRNREAVRVTGSPKFDAIIDRDKLPLKEEICVRKKDRKVIVWKMHFPKKISESGDIKQITPYLDEYINFAKKIDDYKNLFFIALAHPKMLKGVVASDIQGDDSLMMKVRELLEILKDKENVFIDGSDDYRNSFYHADAIILDRSAVMIEAGMLDVPVLLMKNSDYSEPMTKPVQEVCDSFCQGIGCEDMIDFIDKFEKGFDDRKEIRRKAITDNFPYTDGKCGERIKIDILESVNEKHDKPKVVIYGTGEICKYYMNNCGWAVSTEFEIVAVSDSNPKLWNEEFFGYPIVSPKTLAQTDYDAIVITTEPHYFEIKKSLVYDYYLDERRIWRLDEFVYQMRK